MYSFLLKPLLLLFRIVSNIYESYSHEKYDKTLKTDHGISYPAYKSMDEFINIERLKSLDSIITQFIKNYLSDMPKENRNFRIGPYPLKIWQPRLTDAYLVKLRENKSNEKYNYYDLNKTEKWGWAYYAEQLPEVVEFIKTLPFKSLGRVMLIFDNGEASITPHRDHTLSHECHEFIWFNSNKKKKFYVSHSGVKKYITNYSAWFDTVNQFHGADPAGELNYSIRVDGIFTDEFRKQIPRPNINPASTPSLWACLRG